MFLLWLSQVPLLWSHCCQHWEANELWAGSKKLQNPFVCVYKHSQGDNPKRKCKENQFNSCKKVQNQEQTTFVLMFAVQVKVGQERSLAGERPTASKHSHWWLKARVCSMNYDLSQTTGKFRKKRSCQDKWLSQSQGQCSWRFNQRTQEVCGEWHCQCLQLLRFCRMTFRTKQSH